MDKKTIIKNLFEKKEIKDYTYSILFFLVSSFFLIFAVRPALSIAFTLRREVADLRRINKLYEENILKLVEIQSTMEVVRDKMYLLTTAIPLKPDIYNIILDAKRLGSGEFTILAAESAAIDLKQKTPDNKIKAVTISLQATGSYEATRTFIKKLYTQKRLKAIKKMQITRSEVSSSDSADLKVVTDVEAFYL